MNSGCDTELTLFYAWAAASLDDEANQWHVYRQHVETCEVCQRNETDKLFDIPTAWPVAWQTQPTRTSGNERGVM